MGAHKVLNPVGDPFINENKIAKYIQVGFLVQNNKPVGCLSCFLSLPELSPSTGCVVGLEVAEMRVVLVTEGLLKKGTSDKDLMKSFCLFPGTVRTFEGWQLNVPCQQGRATFQ